MANKKFDLAIVGTAGLPARYGGFETLAEQLVEGLSTERSIIVFCSDAEKARQRCSLKYGGASLAYSRLSANGWQSVFYDGVTAYRAASMAHIVLVLGISGGVFLPIIRALTTSKFAVNMDGIEWQRSKFSRFAKTYLKLAELVATRSCDAVIADNLAIKRYLEERYGITPQLIAYGGDQHTRRVGFSASKKAPILANVELPEQFYFGVCRIEPENNVHVILEAFSASEFNLVFVGNWTISKYAVELHKRFSSAANIQLLDPIYDQAALAYLRSRSMAYIHGHSAGGTNPALVEAMSAGSPVLAYDVGFNRETTKCRALYWSDGAHLTKMICSVSEPELRRISSDMSKIATENYRWEKIVRQYDSLLTDLLRK